MKKHQRTLGGGTRNHAIFVAKSRKSARNLRKTRQNGANWCKKLRDTLILAMLYYSGWVRGYILALIGTPARV